MGGKKVYFKWLKNSFKVNFCTYLKAVRGNIAHLCC